MFGINPSQIPSHVQWFRFALCKGHVSYEMGGRMGMNGTRCFERVYLTHTHTHILISYEYTPSPPFLTMLQAGL